MITIVRRDSIATTVCSIFLENVYAQFQAKGGRILSRGLGTTRCLSFVSLKSKTSHRGDAISGIQRKLLAAAAQWATTVQAAGTRFVSNIFDDLVLGDTS